MNKYMLKSIAFQLRTIAAVIEEMIEKENNK